MIIDCHTHCYPADIAAQPRAWAEAHGELHWADLVAPIGRKSIQGWAGPEEFLAAMDAAGVDRAVLLGWYWQHESTCRWHNEVIAEWVRTAPERFIGFASILPNENVLAQLAAAESLGLCGVGELHPGVQGFDSQSKYWRTMAQWCAQHDWPVNCHATAEDGKDHPLAIATPLKDYLRMAQHAPALKLILAHWGGGLPLREGVHLPANIYVDCAASPLLYPDSPVRRVIDAIGAERVLYGSDYPLRLYPRQQLQAEMTRFLASIRQDSTLSPTERSAILGQNMNRLLPR